MIYMVPSQIVDSNWQTIQKLLGLDSDHAQGLEPSQLIAEGVPVTAVLHIFLHLGLQRF